MEKSEYFSLSRTKHSSDNPGKTSHHHRVMCGSRPDFAAGKCYWSSYSKEKQAKYDFNHFTHSLQAGQASDNPVSAQRDPRKARNPFLSQKTIEKKNEKIQIIENNAKKIIQLYHSLAPLEKICNHLQLSSNYPRLLSEQPDRLSVLELDYMLKDINEFAQRIPAMQNEIYQKYDSMIRAVEDAKMAGNLRKLGPYSATFIQQMEHLCTLTKERFITPIEAFNPDNLGDLSENLRKEVIDRLKEPKNFDKLYTLPFDITTYIGPPQDVLNRYEQKAEQHWRKIYQHFYPDEFNRLKGEEGYLAFTKALDDHAKNLVQNANFFRHVQISEIEYLLANPDEKLASMYKNSKDQRKIIRRALKTKAFYNYPHDDMGPMHGYLSINKNGSEKGPEAGLNQSYGTIRLRLKKENLIGKTTVAFDDSWHYYQPKNHEIAVVPRPLAQPDRKAFPIGDNRELLTLQEKLLRRKEEGDPKPIDQTKIKRLLKNKEIRRIVEQLFDSQVERSNEEDHKLMDQLKDLLDKERDHLLLNPLTIKSINDIEAYAEFQHHFTDLTINDIDKVYLPAYSDDAENQFNSIMSGLNALKIKYEFYDV